MYESLWYRTTYTAVPGAYCNTHVFAVLKAPYKCCAAVSTFYSVGQSKTPVDPVDLSPECSESFSFPLLQSRYIHRLTAVCLPYTLVYAATSWDMMIFTRKKTFVLPQLQRTKPSGAKRLAAVNASLSRGRGAGSRCWVVLVHHY